MAKAIERTQLNVRITTQLHRQLKLLAVRLGEPMDGLIEEAIRNVLKTKRGVKPKRTVHELHAILRR